MIGAGSDLGKYHNPTRIVFGPGALDCLPEMLPEGRIFVVTTAGTTARGVTDRVSELIGPARTAIFDQVIPNPQLSVLRTNLEAVPPDTSAVVAIGGGSSLDSGKVLAVLAGRRHLAVDGSPAESLIKVPVGPGESLPVIAIPTTAGTGAEVTPFATVWDFKRNHKHSVTGPGMFPQAALVDPELTVSMPEDITVHTGLDALSQGLEALWNRNAGPVTDALALEAAGEALAALVRLRSRLGDIELRSKMAKASLLAGMAISNTRTALAHSVSYPITAHFGVPHGLACSFTLPAILKFNADSYNHRISLVARALASTTPKEASAKLRQLLIALGVRKEMERYGFDVDRIFHLGPEMITPGRADNNLRLATPEDAVSIVAESWESLT